MVRCESSDEGHIVLGFLHVFPNAPIPERMTISIITVKDNGYQGEAIE
jgi:hypothetical protein